MNSWPFPPETREVQFDEKWSFVGKKEKHCDPANPDDAKRGDNWDHVALDPEHRLVVSVVPGKRTGEHVEALVRDFKTRTEDRPMNLITTDEYKPYRPAILKAYGERIVPQRTGKPGRPRAPYHEPSPDLRYATVHKTRQNGRVVKIDFRVIFGTAAAVEAALRLSKVSNQINTAFVERQNGTDRGRNGRKTRKTYCFSKDWAASRRTGTSMRRSPTSRCTPTTSAGPCGRCVNEVPTANGWRGRLPWPLA
jgi:IS1 family transposase